MLPNAAFKHNKSNANGELFRYLEDWLKHKLEIHINNELRKKYHFEEVETSQLLPLDDKCVAYYVSKFPERHFKVIGHDEESFVLRPAACAGALRRWQNIPRHLLRAHLPFVVHESAICHRMEQKGELKTLERNQWFRMPDYHILTTEQESISVFQTVSHLIKQYYQLGLKLPAEKMKTVVRLNTRSAQQKELLKNQLIDVENVQIDQQLEKKEEDSRPYWTIKVEFTFGELQVGTVQMDPHYARMFQLGSDLRVVHFSPGSYTRLVDVLNKADLLPPEGVRLKVMEDQDQTLEELRTVLGCAILVEDRSLKEVLSSATLWEKTVYPFIIIRGNRESNGYYTLVDIRTQQRKLLTLAQLKDIFKEYLPSYKTYYQRKSYFKYCSI